MGRRTAAKALIGAAIAIVAGLSLGCPSPNARAGTAPTAAPAAPSPTTAPGRAVPTRTTAAISTVAPTTAPVRRDGTPTTPTPVAKGPEPAIDPRLTNRTTAPVVRVIDGDTIHVRIDGQNRSVRIIGMNTPEVPGPYRDPQCFGQEASDRAKDLLTDQVITFAQDPTQDAEDQFRRMLAYVWLPDGRLYEEEMIQGGFAKEYTYDRRRPYLYQDRLRAAEREAREARRGLWAPETCNGNLDRPPGVG